MELGCPVPVSIIIPTYNRSQLLTKAIESSLQQNYPNFEVIVSDNASSDDTSAVVQRYAGDHRLRYFRNATNIGMIGNWRKCVREYVKGDFFILISDDDYFVRDDYLAKAMMIARQNPDVGMVKGEGTQIIFCKIRQNRLLTESVLQTAGN